MLFGVLDFDREALVSPRERNAWRVFALPADILERIGGEPVLVLSGFELGRIRDLIERAGLARSTANCWPQPIGYRIALLLAERGRIDGAFFCHGRDLFRGTRRHVREDEFTCAQVTSGKLLAALQAASRVGRHGHIGKDVRKGKSSKSPSGPGHP